MKKYMIVFLFLLLASCDLVVDVHVPFDGPQLVVNAYFNPDSLWQATVSLNRHILDDSTFEWVENAQVVIYQNGMPLETLIHQKDGMYKSQTGKPVAGSIYEIRATAENAPAITGKSNVPLPATITEVTVSDIPGTQDHPNRSNVRIKFQDDPNVVNYYQILFYIAGQSKDPWTQEVYTYNSLITIESDDPIIKNENSGLDRYDGILLKDVLFNGTAAEIYFNVDISGLESDVDRYYVILRTVSEDYYKYKITAQQQHNASGNPFAQPVNVHNNIENGYGIFGGYSQFVFTHENPVITITSIEPLSGKAGDHILIRGENFILPGKKSSTDVEFPAMVSQSQPVALSYFAKIVHITETELEVIVPDKAVTGKINIRVNGRSVTSDVDFEVIN